jgi:hypothetical protein
MMTAAGDRWAGDGGTMSAPTGAGADVAGVVGLLGSAFRWFRSSSSFALSDASQMYLRASDTPRKLETFP